MGKAKARAMEVPECWSHGLDSSGLDRVGQPELEILQAACSNSTRAAQTSALALAVAEAEQKCQNLDVKE